MGAIENERMSPQIIDLMNQRNCDSFYNKEKSVDILKAYADRGGLASGCDIKSIAEYLPKSGNLLEVGAGYGRVIDTILKSGFIGKIVGLEKSERLYDYLCKRYDDRSENVNIICCDVMKYNPGYKFDIITSLWSNISDFSKTTQLDYLERLSFLMSDTGSLFLDVSVSDVAPLNASAYDKQTFQVEPQDGYFIEGYIPSVDEISDYVEKLGLVIKLAIRYSTDTGRQRLLFIFTK